MPARRTLCEGVDLARPLLAFERAEIRAVRRSGRLAVRVDPTERRSGASPQCRPRGARRPAPAVSGLDSAVSRAADLVAAELAQAPEAALRRQVRDALQEHQALRGVDFEHVEAAVRALERGSSGRFSMGSGVHVTIENGALTVHREMR